MGENNKILGGTLFIADKPFDGVCEEVEYVTESFSGEHSIYIRNDIPTALTCALHVNKDAMAKLLGVTDEVIRLCENRRVKHLSRYGKIRTRKKNLHRMFRILEKGVVKTELSRGNINV